MLLTPEQQAMLDGAEGEVMAKVMRSLVMYGETFGAEKMVPVTSKYGHTVISFGIGVMKPVYELYDKLLEAGAVSKQRFSADPLPLDRKVPSNLLQDIIFKRIMYSEQGRYEAQLEKFGLLSRDAFTCACYLDEVGNKPGKGEVLSWAESSAVVYANSVLGAVQPQLRHAGADGLHRGLRAVLRPAHRRRAKGRLDSRGQNGEEAGGAAPRLGHRHEGHGAGAVHKGPR